jgi:hypothetical protein
MHNNKASYIDGVLNIDPHLDMIQYIPFQIS